MTNFDFLQKDAQFASFATVAVSAEQVLASDIVDKEVNCVTNCRRAMEFAVKWMYSVDGYLNIIRAYSIAFNKVLFHVVTDSKRTLSPVCKIFRSRHHCVNSMCCCHIVKFTLHLLI